MPLKRPLKRPVINCLATEAVGMLLPSGPQRSSNMASSNPDREASSTDTPLSLIQADPPESPSSSQEHLPLAYDQKTAYYNSASEKSISHAEAKMIYRRHILEASDQDCQRSLKRMRVSPSLGDSADDRSAANRTYGPRQSPPDSLYCHRSLINLRHFSDPPKVS